MKNLPAGRDYPAVAGYGGNVYVLGGGVNASAYLGNFTGARSSYEYDVATNAWKTLAPMPVAEVGAAAVTGSDGLIYVIGGTQQTINGSCIQTIQIYNPKTNTWTQSALPDTDPLGGQTTGVFSEGAAAIGTQLYFVGGTWLEPNPGGNGIDQGFLNTMFTATTS